MNNYESYALSASISHSHLLDGSLPLVGTEIGVEIEHLVPRLCEPATS